MIELFILIEGEDLKRKGIGHRVRKERKGKEIGKWVNSKLNEKRE